jgi:hypothetical protein
VLRREARCSSSSCSLDSSVWREVRLHRRVARRIDVLPSSGYVYRSRDWKILSDPLDQEVHRERSGQTIRIILVSDHQVDHGAIGVVELIFDPRGGECRSVCKSVIQTAWW